MSHPRALHETSLGLRLHRIKIRCYPWSQPDNKVKAVDYVSCKPSKNVLLLYVFAKANSMKRKSSVLIASVLVIGIFLLTMLIANAQKKEWGHSCSVPPLGFMAFRIPEREEIKRVQLELFNSSGDLPDIKPFDVDEKYIDEIYWFLDKCEVDTIPYVVYPDYGSIRLVLKSGEVMTIALHQTGSKTPQQFSMMGVRIKQNSKNWTENKSRSDLEHLVRRIYYQQTGHFTFDVPGDSLDQHELSVRPKKSGASEVCSGVKIDEVRPWRN
ncbi:MAG: hypothetical protein ACO1RA_08770 [Planctomycetaceae bacterium]